LDFNWDLKGDSDHYSFFSNNVPILMLHTGMHSDYHRPSDDAERVNGEGIKQVAQLIFGTAVELAEAPSLGRFRSQSRFESNTLSRMASAVLSPPPGRLGIRWDSQAAAKGRIVVAAVTPGSSAAEAGVKVGDRFVQFADLEVGDERRFRIAVLAAANPVSVTIERPGEKEPLKLELKLAGEPVRLGIAWRRDDAEPGAVIVNRLTVGSPAEMAGIRPGDRIYRINGQEFATGEEFRQLAVKLADPLVLEVETSGRVRSVEIPRLEASAPSPTAAEQNVKAAPPDET
jgi:S1-C subfamily serine protease